MKRLAILVVAVAAGWAGYWAVSSAQTRAAVEAWFEDRRDDGWQAEYDTLSVGGFPNRLDVTLTGVALADPDRGVAWRIPMLQALQLVYRRDHAILVFADTQDLATPTADYRIASDGLRASVVFGADDTLDRAGLEAAALSVDGPDGAVALSDVTAGLGIVEGEAATYRLGLEAAGTQQDTLSVQAEIALDSPLARGTPAGDTPQPQRIDLRLAEYRAGDLLVRTTGTVEADADGRAEGALTLRAENWRTLLDRAVADGRLPASIAGALRDGLGLMTALSGNPDRLDLPLRFERGSTRLGPVPLGPAPLLRLP